MSNQQKAIANLMVSVNPEAVAPTVFPRAGAPYELVEESGVETKFSAIVDGISGGLGFSADRAATRLDEAASLRPWLDDVSPLIRLASIEAEFAKNEAIIDALTAHLTEHVVIREELRSQAERARRQAALENRRIPEFLEEFAERLVVAGVIKGDLRFMPKQRFDAIVALIRGLAEKPEDGSPLIADEVAEAADSGVSEVDAPIAEPEVVEDASDIGGAISGEEVVEAEVVPAEEPAAPVVEGPPGRWDSLEAGALGFSIEEVQPSSDDDLAALRMRLPEVDNLRALALTHGMEKAMVDSWERFGEVDSASKVVRSWADRTGVRMSDRDVRAWVFLLGVMGDAGRQLGRDVLASFDGLALPGRKGSPKVRRVRFAG